MVPDQIGFGRSSKPDIHYSFHLLAANTKQLLDHLDIKKAAVLGHSMGGMLATRFALMYPETVTHLILEDPIGLEDYRVFVPYAPLEALYAAEMKASEESIRKYHRTYYVEWKPEYDDYVKLAARQRLSGEYPRLALASALTYLMIYEQPVCYEFPHVKAKTLLIIGQADRTVVGKARVPKELLPQLGQYPALGQKTAKLIPHATLVEIPQVGHVPHFEAPGAVSSRIAGLPQPAGSPLIMTQHIHLLGICGTGMAALAGILKEQGFRVSGSDEHVYPPMSTLLEGLGIPIQNGYRPENLTPVPDLVVVGNVIRRDNPEAQAVLEKNLPRLSLPEALNRFLVGDRQSLVVAGTHGKTTTTALISWLLFALGLDPGFMVGGIAKNFQTNYRVGRGRYVALEGDEYDTAFFDKRPKFVHFHPRAAVLTSIEFDHADIYPDLDRIILAFETFL